MHWRMATVRRLKNVCGLIAFAFLFYSLALAVLLFQFEDNFTMGVSWNSLPVQVRSFQQKPLITNNRSSCHNDHRSGVVDEFVRIFQSRYSDTNNLLKLDSQESYETFLKRWSSHRKIGIPLVRGVNSRAKTSSEKYHRGINQFYMYDPYDPMLPELLRDLAVLPVTSAVFTVMIKRTEIKWMPFHLSTEVPEVGSQLKLHLTFVDGSQARFKPARHIAESENNLDAIFMSFFEHYQGEIAGFHLDRVLGFHRAVPTVGRSLNITEILQTLVDAGSSVQHVYTSYTGDLCFVMRCLQYCGPDYPYCGLGDALAGAVSAELPPRQTYYKTVKDYPYALRYSFGEQADWEADDRFCDLFVKPNVTFYTLLEFMDLAVYDFLTGNLDRHNYRTFANLGETSFVPVYDNGRGFSQSSYDHMWALIPLKQCCLIRLSTLTKLIKLYHGPDSLSKVMRSSLNSDPLSPVLTEPHLDALDRRLPKILKTISDCLANASSWHDVIIDELSVL